MSQHFVVNIDEGVRISEYNKVTTELDAIIYRNEFDKYRTAYLSDKTEQGLIFCFVFLQIYIECFLHQNMRRVVEMEFKPPREDVCNTWLSRERRGIEDKVDAFVANFFAPPPDDVLRITKIVKDGFKQISDVRNLFVHGHKVARWSDSEGNSGITSARALLVKDYLDQMIHTANDIGIAWNELLDKTMPQYKALRQIDHFKFVMLGL